MTSFKIGISGSYGGLNLGDEAILQGIISSLRSSVPSEITVFSRVPEDTRKRHDVERVVAVREIARDDVSREIEDLDLFILGGGGIIYDADAKIYLREMEIAQQHSVPTMTYAVGVGPLTDANAQKQVRETLSRASAVTVRGQTDKRLLQDIGLRRDILVTADPGLLLQPEPLPDEALVTEHIEGKRRLVGMSLREPGVAAPNIDNEFYLNLLANVADFMIDRFGADVLFFPMERRTFDLQLSHAVMARMLEPQRAWVLRGDYSPGQMLSLIRHCDMAVGMRLHFLMFAALQAVPFVALPYSSKVTALIEDLGLVMPPIDRVNAGRLIAHIDSSWDMRSGLREKINKALPSLQERARKTNEVAVALLKHLPLPKETAPAASLPGKAVDLQAGLR